MHPSPCDARPAPLRTFAPALALSGALLGLLAAGGVQAWVQLRMAPATLMQAGAEAAAASPNQARSPAAQGAALPPLGEPGRAAEPVETGPGWEALSTQQKQALYPLAERWAQISQAQKRRWLTLAASYPGLSEPEQGKFLDRITDWANLSAQQRNQARLNYAVTNRLAPDDKRAQWAAYQALSDEERRALAARAAPKPRGAATALHPVAPQKLAQVSAAQTQPGRPNAPKIAPASAHWPRVAAPVPPMPQPLTAQAAPGGNPGAAPAGVETAPVPTPVAVPVALPLLGASPASAAPQALPPGTPGLYAQ